MANILLVEDHEDVRETIKETLSEAGHNVTEAQDGRIAQELIYQNTYALIITDIMMPNKTGFDLISETKDKFPKMKIIAISGGGKYSTSELTCHLARLRADQALAKPFMPEDILNAVNDVLSES